MKLQTQIAAILGGLTLFAALASATPTYSREVAPILQAKCQICHQPNNIAPFALMTYDDAVTWSKDIQRVVHDHIMPPWKPSAGSGEFKNSYGLTDRERRTILDWIQAGVPQGDPAILPPPAQPTGDWQLGAPDLTLTMAQPFYVPVVQDLYRCFVLPTSLAQNTFVQASEVKPGQRQVVHHVLLFVDETGASEKLDGQDGQPGYTCFGGPGDGVNLSVGGMVGAWVPGARVQKLPDNVGVSLPSKARIVMQVHYHNPSGLQVTDQSSVGLYFNQGPVDKHFLSVPVLNTSFVLKPGDTKDVTASFTIPPFFDAHLIEIGPHMHLLGRKIKVAVMSRDGSSTTPLIEIDDWDFNWQGFYTYENPVALPAGSTVKLTCSFDNTLNNPKNPNNPLKTVTWGEGTTDEMCLAFMGIVLDGEHMAPSASVRTH